MAANIINEIKFELEKRIEGEVKLDAITRVLYSTDASIYQVEPLGVVFPKSSEDVIAVVEMAAKYGIPILPRGAGSSLAGQTVGTALVIDFSRYLNKAEDLNLEEKSVWVRPGMVLSQFNQYLAQYGLQFGPDPASGERATLGGMTGNNSTGAHSISYGMTVDHVLEIEGVLADGNPMTLGTVGLDELQGISNGEGILAGIAHTVLDIRSNHAEVIRQNWPKTWRNSSGYALNYIIPWSASAPPAWIGNEYPPVAADKINLAKLMVGSEGTLGVFNRVKVGLVEVPQNKVLGILEFDSVAAAAERTPALLALGPSAVELVPRAILEKARAVPAYASRLSFLTGSPAAILLVEFSGEDIAYLLEQAKKIGNNALIIEDPVKQRQLWEVRKVGLGLLMYMVGDAKPIPFIEDVAVPVDVLGEFVHDFERVLEEHGTVGNFYAHASAGCLHIRPVLNTKSEDDIEKMVSITRSMVEVILKYGGALSGEHGDGLARAMWLEQVYSPEVVDLFKQVKSACDPAGILNPGKIVELPPMDERLRYGIEYSAKPWEPVLDFSVVDGLAGAIEMCNGAGVCRKATGSMCPTFQASQNEMHSTRGRANLLREYISGKLIPTEVAERAAFEALEMCLSCKACKAECPSAVDVAALKYEFMHHYYESHSRPLRDYLFGYIGEFARVGKPFSGLVNLFTQSNAGKAFLDGVVGISKDRTLPALGSKNRAKQDPEMGFKEEVIILSDPFSEYFSPELMADLLAVLSAIGVKAIGLPVVGTGRTKLSKGFIEPAIKHLKRVVEEIRRIDPEQKLPVLGIEPSEIVMLTDDMAVMLPQSEEIKGIQERTFSLAEYLIRSGADGQPRYKRLGLSEVGNSILLHGHCYQKAMKAAADGLPNGIEADIFLLNALGCEVELIEAGCCGMAGAFGYEKEHLEMSKKVAETKLLPAVRARKAGQQLVASGASCRAQLDSLAGEDAIHLNRLIAGFLQ